MSTAKENEKNGRYPYHSKQEIKKEKSSKGKNVSSKERHIFSERKCNASFLIGGMARVILRVILRLSRCTKGFLNYFSAIIKFLKVVFKGEIVKFSKNCGTFVIKESGGVKVQIMEKKLENFKNSKMIINYQNGSRKPRKFSRSRMTKQTVPLNSSREI